MRFKSARSVGFVRILNHIDAKLTLFGIFTQFYIGKSLVFLINDAVNYMTFAHLAR